AMDLRFSSRVTMSLLASFLINSTIYLTQTSLHVYSVDVGSNVVLQCLCQDYSAVMFYWYKQILGQEPKLMCTFYKHTNTAIFKEEFNNSRFSLDTGNYRNVVLKISDVKISDAATFHCVQNNLNDYEFCEGTTLIVKGSGPTIETLVRQSESENIEQGDSESLKCAVQTGSCGGQHGVYWFRNSEESHPGLIYTQGGRSDPSTQTHTCVYNLPMKVPNETYCAVASCGEILFGNRTKLDSEGEPLFHFHKYLGVEQYILFFLKSFFFFKQASDSQDGENLQYASVSHQKMNISRTRADGTFTECVYSSVKR
uniref:Ig-like domain-containing protein n=1 Tax=Xiphophorus couchianus TaxID=32473 RepID=A0A3B5LDX6_9TELE